MPAAFSQRNVGRYRRQSAASGAATTFVTLASGGTLTNGAQTKTAGGTPSLPARLCPEDNYFFDTGQDNQGIVFAANDRDIWVITNSTTLKKYNFAGSLLATSAAFTSPRMVSRLDSGKLLVGRLASTTFYEYTEASDTVTSRVAPTSGTIVVVGSTGKYWSALVAGSTWTEFDATTLAATGRTITTTGPIQAGWSSAADGTLGLYSIEATSVAVRKYKDSDLTLEKTWTVSGVQPNPGSNFGLNSIIVDPTGRPVVNGGQGFWDLFTLAQGDQKDLATRLVWPGNDMAGGTPFTTGGGNQSLPGACYSQDGRYFAFLATDSTNTTTDKGVRVLNTLVQKAVYQIVNGSPRNLNSLIAAGNFGNSYGNFSGWRSNATQDYRRTRFYYQRLGVDGAPVEVTPNTDLGSVAMAGGSTLELTVEFRNGPGFPGVAQPYVERLGILTS